MCEVTQLDGGRHVQAGCSLALDTPAPLLLTALAVGNGAPALADDGPVTGGDVCRTDCGPGQDVVAQEAAKSALAEAYVSALEDSGNVKAFDETLKRYSSVFPQRFAESGRAAMRPERGASARYRFLGLKHFAQINDWACGPASGRMILNHLGAGRSAVNGAKQNQRNIGGPKHMNTWSRKVTPWASHRFRIGLNRWQSNSNTGYFVETHAPTAKIFRNTLLFSIGRGTPFGADTVELAGRVRYNNHPDNGRDIGHWLTVIGYVGNGSRTRFADPSTSVWVGPVKKFGSRTRYFVNTFLPYNGIVW